MSVEQEAQLDALVQSYMQHLQQQGAAQGKSPEQMEQAMQHTAFVLLLRLLQQALGAGVELKTDELLTLWPSTAEQLFQSVAAVLEISAHEAQEICTLFQAQGWLQADLRPSKQGLTLAGLST